MVYNSEKGGNVVLRSGQADASYKLCVWFCLKHFCFEVHEGPLPHDKNDSDKTVHNLQLTSAWK